MEILIILLGLGFAAFSVAIQGWGSSQKKSKPLSSKNSKQISRRNQSKQASRSQHNRKSFLNQLRSERNIANAERATDSNRAQQRRNSSVQQEADQEHRRTSRINHPNSQESRSRQSHSAHERRQRAKQLSATEKTSKKSIIQKQSTRPANRSTPSLNQQNLKQAVIYTEILNKPKSLR
ncbi:hypothetical protein [Dolosigranulum pigrum]|jgi:hypothetical protein|uniref:hypothetical protein n=1 Tax=Dolosigranulum pigrum TaxID=29394 RepID=UPI000DC02EC7|nr:hypothetical protein [Dolosigranulum pigrum]RAN60114.1 hypothetical protein B8A46_04180 [Dolosigranulum pigrum]